MYCTRKRGEFRRQRVKMDDDMRNEAVRIFEEHSSFALKQIIQYRTSDRVLSDKPAVISISSLANLWMGI